MECRDVDDLIDSHLDGELPAERMSDLDAHVGRCRRCAGRHGDLLRFLRDPGPVKVPDGLRDRIVSAIEAGRPTMPQPRTSGWLRWGGAVAAAAALFFLGRTSTRIWRPPGVEAIVPPRTAEVARVDAAPDPWMVSGLLQTIALPGPVVPVHLAMQARAAELIASSTAKELPTIPVRRRPIVRAPLERDDAVPPIDLPMVPPVHRL